LTAFASVLLDVVLVSNFGTIAVGRYSMLVSAHNLRDLRVKECADIALLIDNS
jgi:hypothetical protein